MLIKGFALFALFALKASKLQLFSSMRLDDNKENQSVKFDFSA